MKLVRLLALVVIAGCGGGVGTGGTGSYTVGSITGFGSVIVGDIRFDDAAAAVTDSDGTRRARDDLRLGMTVEVSAGEIGTDTAGNAVAVASAIRYVSALRGPVSGVEAAAGAFTLLGQRVLVDATTVFAESLGALTALSGGTPVEVYAAWDAATASYRAKRVDAASATAAPRLSGPVSQIDAAAGTLRIGSATYSYGGAPPSGLAAGQFVQLQVAAQPAANGRWPVQAFGATQQPPGDADGARFTGLVTAFTSIASFSVDGRPVDASGAAFPDGRAGVVLGARVEVQGSVRNGVLVAGTVGLRGDAGDPGMTFELRGAITAVDAAARTFVVRNQTVSTVRADLRYEGGTAADLVVGRRVDVQGRLSADRLRVEAVRITFE